MCENIPYGYGRIFCTIRAWYEAYAYGMYNICVWYRTVTCHYAIPCARIISYHSQLLAILFHSLLCQPVAKESWFDDELMLDRFETLKW